MEETMEMGDQSPKRPTFLTAICIISWVGCALALISSVYSYFSAEVSLRQMETMGDMGGMMEGMMESAQAAYDNRAVTMTINLISSVLCLIGTIMMWNLKKIGYFIYIPGELVPAIAGFIFGAGTWGMIGAVVGLIIGAVWVLLYGLNLKHMK
ncbi:MAG: hypothetical protein Q8M29_12140 [Bacteroidota bacterium]|nr:hypothetical protein [Bacteroidota bacterium]